MKSRIAIPLALVFAFALGFAGCRGGKRGVRVGGEAATLKVSATYPKYSMDPSGWVYELSGCDNLPVLSGTPDGDNSTLIFKGVGLKPGQTCQLRVKDLAADPSMIAFSQGEDKVLFWTNTVQISQNAVGQLIASASLNQLYNAVPQPGVEKFTLVVPVAFPAKVERPNIVASLNCEPSVFNTATYPAAAPVNGEFSFLLPLGATKDYTCKTLTVAAFDPSNATTPILNYSGDFEKDAATFTASNGGTITIAKPIVLKAVSLGGGGGDGDGSGSGGNDDDGVPDSGDAGTEGVIINASPEDCTGPGDRYDVEEHKCYKGSGAPNP